VFIDVGPCDPVGKCPVGHVENGEAAPFLP
jgi:hypothetical protein